jgi:hypothetical protein
MVLADDLPELAQFRGQGVVGARPPKRFPGLEGNDPDHVDLAAVNDDVIVTLLCLRRRVRTVSVTAYTTG